MVIDDAHVHIFMMIVKICADLHLFFCYRVFSCGPTYTPLQGPLSPLNGLHLLFA